MLSTLRKISFLNKIFNVHGNEWSRVRFAWLIRFVFRFAFVMGWTILLVLFVQSFGIINLPVLFILNAVFTMIGSFFYSTLLEYFSRKNLMVTTAFLASVLFAIVPFLYAQNQILFFGIIIPTVSILMMQLSMMILSFIEEIFTSIESERTFPFLESAETIGGIFGGLLIVILSSIFSPVSLIYVWSFSNLAIIPIILYRKKILHYDVVHVEAEDMPLKEHGLINRVKESLSSKHIRAYVAGLFAIVFLQWFIFVILDFQYTTAIFSTVEGVIVDSSGFEHAFIESLGGLNMLFYGSALLMQLFFASRIINFLGVVGSMTLHAVVTFMSMIALLFNFNFVAAIVVRNNFTMTSIINTSSYHSSYYAVRERLRIQLREILEGVVRPLGAIFGTFFIFGFSWLFDDFTSSILLTICMMSAAMFMVIFTVRQKNKYSNVALSDLKKSKCLAVRFNAVDVLARKGNEDILSILCDFLLNNEEPRSLRVRIAESLSKSQQIHAIPFILKLLEDDDFYLKESALDALDHFVFLKKSNTSKLFLKTEIVNRLKYFYKNDNSQVLRAKALKLLAEMSLVASTDFLLSILRSTADVDKIQVLSLIAKLNDDDFALYVKPFLDSNSTLERVFAAIALYKFDEFKEQAGVILSSALESKQKNVFASGVYAIGELGLKKYSDLCYKALEFDNEYVKMHASLALLKLGEKDSLHHLVDLIFSADRQEVEKFKIFIEELDDSLESKINESLKEFVFKKIRSLMRQQKIVNVQEFEKSQLQTLLWFYKLIGEYDEVEVIQDIISIK